MTGQEAIDFIQSIPPFMPKELKEGEEPFNLDTEKELLHRLGNPERKLKFIHIAGTNGKGSTAAFIYSIFRAAGYKTGLYTSPALERFTERIRVDEGDISMEALGRLTGLVKETADRMAAEGHSFPSEFEILCAVAFLYFLEQKCEMVVLEVGLGGRLDATNVIETSELSVITTISFDHMATLGNTLEQIAGEKAGIIKNGGRVLIHPQRPEVEEVFKRVCREALAELWIADLPEKTDKYDLTGQEFTLKTGKGKTLSLRTSLLGAYQTGNAAVAVRAALLLAPFWPKLTEKAIKKGIEEAKWPGRFELMRRDPAVVIDGGHNEEGAGVLKESLMRYFPGKKILFVTGVLRDKEYARMYEKLIPLAKRFYTLTPPSPRALPAEELSKYLADQGAEVKTCGNPVDGLKAALSEADEEDVICAFGSLYYLGSLRGYLLNKD